MKMCKALVAILAVYFLCTIPSISAQEQGSDPRAALVAEATKAIRLLVQYPEQEYCWSGIFQDGEVYGHAKTFSGDTIIFRAVMDDRINDTRFLQEFRITVSETRFPLRSTSQHFTEKGTVKDLGGFEFKNGNLRIRGQKERIISEKDIRDEAYWEYVEDTRIMMQLESLNLFLATSMYKTQCVQ